MSTYEKLYQKIMSGRSDANVSFSELCNFVRHYSNREHILGDHFIFRIDGCPERINLQPIGSKAKPYQVKQVREIVTKLEEKEG